MVKKQKGGFFGFLPMMMNMFTGGGGQRPAPPPRQRGGWMMSNKQFKKQFGLGKIKKRKQKGVYSPIEKIRRRQRKIMLKAKKLQKGGWFGVSQKKLKKWARDTW